MSRMGGGAGGEEGVQKEGVSETAVPTANTANTANTAIPKLG